MCFIRGLSSPDQTPPLILLLMSQTVATTFLGSNRWWPYHRDSNVKPIYQCGHLQGWTYSLDPESQSGDNDEDEGEGSELGDEGSMGSGEGAGDEGDLGDEAAAQDLKGNNVEVECSENRYPLAWIHQGYSAELMALAHSFRVNPKYFFLGECEEMVKNCRKCKWNNIWEVARILLGDEWAEWV
ncbi:hypothetical protein DFP72DRAFT_860607 [Ephemerocybe angulata]|uniref:Uncharacterized protein n=1 Tax=Ephemerocybe angulata TaxID=980116 RepID=A0A8H6LV66_9AGAR|nr:hypothetical protein DFP72DRAFT_860607 [Tulosesus angulatus]